MLVRRRYYTWLLKAYVKRWKKTILYSVLGGIIIFFVAFALITFSIKPLLEKKVQKVGFAGAHTVQTIPDELLSDVSYGLTEVDPSGQIKPKAANKWEIKQNGKEYIFHIKQGQFFHDGTELTSETVNLNFKDVKKKVIDTYTVSYSLSAPYSPFLTTVSKPLFRNNYVGLGDYKVRNFELNGGYIKSMTLQLKDNSTYKKIFYFYPTREALKTAFALGEVDTLEGINNLSVEGATDFSEWKNIHVDRNVNYSELVVLFYNNLHNELSNKKLRQALNYAVPQEFEEGVRSFSPIAPQSIYFSSSPNSGISDIEIAQELFKSAQTPVGTKLTIATVEEFIPVAQKIEKEWEKLGLDISIQTVTDVRSISENPGDFTVLLYQIRLPKDPDQYTLWHSNQTNNIGRYKNLRIDKLLEDGRVTFEEDRRRTIYADFQKYLIDDVPASFLYFPYEYRVLRG